MGDWLSKTSKLFLSSIVNRIGFVRMRSFFLKLLEWVEEKHGSAILKASDKVSQSSKQWQGVTEVKGCRPNLDIYKTNRHNKPTD